MKQATSKSPTLQNNALRLVMLDCPLDTWSDSRTQHYFAKAVELKLGGFKANYPCEVLPVSEADFFATHFLVCQQRNGTLHPLSAWWLLDLKRCQRFATPFPAIPLTQKAEAPDHETAIRKLVASVDGNGGNMVYGGSWAMCPSSQKDPILRAQIREMSLAAYLNWYQEREMAAAVIGATARFKVDRVFAPLGFENLSLEKQNLSTIGVKHLKDEAVQLMTCGALTDTAKKMVASHKVHWDARLVL